MWRGERTWNGVAILSRNGEPVVTRTALPGDDADGEARYIEAAVNGILIACIYLPNGNPQPGPKFDYKLAWFKRLQAHARALLRTKATGRSRRRLQCRADRNRHLPDKILGRRRAGAAREPGRVCAAPQAGLDRRIARAQPRRARLHVLALHAAPLRARCRIAARSSAAQSHHGETSRGRRRRPRGPRRTRRERSCPGLDHPDGWFSGLALASEASGQREHFKNSQHGRSDEIKGDDCRIHRPAAVQVRRPAAVAKGLGARGQARRLSHADPGSQGSSNLAHAQGARLDRPVSRPRRRKPPPFPIASSTARLSRSTQTACRGFPRCSPRCPRDGIRISSISPSTCCSKARTTCATSRCASAKHACASSSRTTSSTKRASATSSTSKAAARTSCNRRAAWPRRHHLEAARRGLCLRPHRRAG